MTRLNKIQKNREILHLFDFDYTIYNGNSTIDYFLFSISCNPMLLRYLPIQIWHLILYLLRLEDKNNFKGNYFCFIRGINNLDGNTILFWQNNERKLKSWYMKRDKSKDVIVSASPEFYLKPICKTLGVRNLIATKLDIKTGKLIGENCYGEEKPLRIINELPGKKFGESYTDSMSDSPMLELASKKYLVRGNDITLINS